MTHEECSCGACEEEVEPRLGLDVAKLGEEIMNEMDLPKFTFSLNLLDFGYLVKKSLDTIYQITDQLNEIGHMRDKEMDLKRLKELKNLEIGLSVQLQLEEGILHRYIGVVADNGYSSLEDFVSYHRTMSEEIAGKLEEKVKQMKGKGGEDGNNESLIDLA